MVTVFELFCITVLDTSYERGGGFGEFVAAGVLQPSDYSRISARTKELLKILRHVPSASAMTHTAVRTRALTLPRRRSPVAVPLVDSWNIPDFLLNSCLGRCDGCA